MSREGGEGGEWRVMSREGGEGGEWRVMSREGGEGGEYQSYLEACANPPLKDTSQINKSLPFNNCVRISDT